MIAARGRHLKPKSDKNGSTLSEVACLLFEFSWSHRIGSGRFLFDDGSMGRTGSYESRIGMEGWWICLAENGLKSTNANITRETTKAIRRGERLLE